MVESHDPKPGGHRRQPRFRRVPLRLIVPNLVTLLALCSGLTAVRMAYEGVWDFAVGAILLAAVLDGVDGRVARYMKGTSRFGAELDSLADFVNFGVTPALMLYLWILKEAGSIGWIAALIFAISAALRLARFNVALDDPQKPAWTHRFFTGVPAPAGALTVLLPLYLDFLGLFPHWFADEAFVAAYTILIAFLLISRLPTFSGKSFGTRVRRDYVLPLFVVAVLIVALVVSYPFRMLAGGSVLYLLSIPFSWREHRKLVLADASLALDDDGDECDTDLDNLGDRDKDHGG
ncbi:phosphatidylcholine/phosphatidylserine synthase [Labrenzia sp. 011]|uniref:CDP-alcohol phosphatidyltransferase family protein n=1 Tax=Labrenzia sp. 011 TaxID=2171494 RepID=UPI000D5089A2|nr:phosphatidylcholine/phosphatidylserine synthase [Labrenzia sp. 011]PVB63364.1 CDP-diacylglycerol--serine O-phosphatidyltransferase [Labrenzia sp. 011]